MSRRSDARLAALLLAIAFGAGPGAVAKAGGALHTPAAGSAERMEIALAIHAPCERDLKQDVLLKFERIVVCGEWAFARVTPLQPNGEPIDYGATKFKEQIDLGMFDATGEALLQRTHRAWKMSEWRFGNPDTAVAEWLQKHKAPAALAQ